MMRDAVVQLTDARALVSDLVGGKGAHLARLARAGLPVPAGFCVTTTAYGSLTEEAEVRERIRALSGVDPADTDALRAAGAAVRERIADHALPQSVCDELADAWTVLGGDTVAVRSSATVEDLPTASVAGQHDTFLGVRGIDELVAAVICCMASLFSDRAIAYRARSSIPQEDARMAVTVQRQLDPVAAGVLFTADPRTGNRRVTTVDAVLGLGTALVGGAVDADHAALDRRTRAVSYTVGDQRTAVRLATEGGTETVALDAAARAARVLSDAQVRDLDRLGLRVQRLFGTPQDIEWAQLEEGFAVLQARPIVGLFPVPTPAPPDTRLHVYVSVGHMQSLPQAIPPLARDVFVAFYEAELQQEPYASLSEGGQWVAEAGGRLYLDATPMARRPRMRAHLPGYFGMVSEAVEVALADVLARRADEFVVPSRRALPGLLRGARRQLRTTLPTVPALLTGLLRALFTVPDTREEQVAWEAFGRRMAEPVVAAGPDPLARTRAVFDTRAASLFLDELMRRVTPLLTGFIVGAVLDRWFTDARADLDAVSAGFPDEIVTRINLGLGDLADVARAHPQVAAAVRAGAGVEAITSVDGGEAFGAALRSYLDEFGHRATGELDTSRPRWREDQTGLLRVVAANLTDAEPGRHRAHLRRLEDGAQDAARRLEQHVAGGLLGLLRRRLARWLIRVYRGHIQLREHPKQGMAHLFAAWHDALASAGAHLAGEGRLAAADDVWFLHEDELFAALEGAPAPADLAARRRTFDHQETLVAPAVVTSEGEIADERLVRADAPPGALVGTAVSGGVAEGPARVVRDPAHDTVRPGEILVAPGADPGWTPLFLNAAAIVTEVGGRLSHGALVAREYGLPAVASVTGATTTIRTGQRIRVDGSNGTVEVLADQPSGIEQK